MKKWTQIITEAAYPGNIGFEEITKYYQTATPTEIKKLESIIKKANWEDFKKQIEKVLGTKLI